MLKIFLVIALISVNISLNCTKTIHFQKYVPNVKEYEVKNQESDLNSKHQTAQSIDGYYNDLHNPRKNSKNNYIQRLIMEAKNIHSPNLHRKIQFKKLIKQADYLNNNPEGLSDAERLAINTAIEHNFINLLKRVYAITSRSRYGR